MFPITTNSQVMNGISHMHKIITSILEIFGRLEEFGCVKSVLLFGKLPFKKKKETKKISLSVKIKPKKLLPTTCLFTSVAAQCSHVTMEQDGVEEQHLWLSKPSLVVKSSPASVVRFQLDCDSGSSVVSSVTHLSTPRVSTDSGHAEQWYYSYSRNCLW